MALYGKEELLITTEHDHFKMVGRPCEMSSFSFVPTERHESKETTYYNSEKQDRYSHSTYDRLFHQDYGYNNKLHRCDREHAKSRGLIVNHEEKTKDVPTLASTNYGHRLENQLDPPDRKNVRIAHVQTEFFRRNMFNIKPPEGLEDGQH